MAADLDGASRASCVGSDVLQLKRPALTLALQQDRDEALAASKDQSVVYSRSPAFDWAVAAVVQCNVALGYLAGGHVDKASASKCDCFHSRMAAAQ